MGEKELARLMDFTYLEKPFSANSAEDFLDAACKYGVRGVCSNLEFFGKPLICECSVLFIAVIDFPYGNGGIEIKKQEAELAKYMGINEVDVVININALKRNDYKIVEDELRVVTEIFGKKTKVILETGAMSKPQLQLHMACEIANFVGAGWVKTSTGFNFNIGFNEKLQHVKILKEIIQSQSYDLKIKMSGGLETLEQLEKGIEAGADIFGISWQKAITILETPR